jgi:RNA polymerase sigma-70 factor (TIGR02943 family)
MESEQQTVLAPEFWVKRYADAMLNFAFRRTNDLPLSEDLVQDTFFSALKARAHFKGNSQEKTWLYAILENKITDYFRSSRYAFQTQKVSLEEEFYTHFFEKESEGGHWLNEQKPHDWGQMAAGGYGDDSAEFDQTLTNCLKKLPQKLEHLFILKYVEEFETEKICKELALTTSNYWVMIHRAKLQLRACLETNWFVK